jgi:hypothetical protein
VPYSLWYNAPNMWPAGGLEAEELIVASSWLSSLLFII